MTMPITTGIKRGPEKVVIYGPPGVGKTSLAAEFPKPVFTDTEGSTSHIDVARTPTPRSWSALLKIVDELTKDHQGFETYVLDTADWAERLCIEHLCNKHTVDGLEGFGYGKGFTYLSEEFGRFLDALTALAESGMNVVLTAHAHTRKIELPEETGAFDKWEMKLSKTVRPLVQEWSFMILFANYEVLVIEQEKTKTKKGTGGRRVMYTDSLPTWDAKNRHGLKPKLPLKYSEIAHIFDRSDQPQQATATPPAPEPKPEEPQAPAMSKVERQLRDLMAASNVEDEEILRVVALKGWFPEGTELKTIIDNGFVEKNLIPNWDKCVKLIEKEVRASV